MRTLGTSPRIMRGAFGAALIAATMVSLAPVGDAATERATPYLEDARRYLGKGDVRAAIIQLRNAVRSDPNDPALRIELANAYLQISDGPSAEKEFKVGREHGADEADFATGLARAYLIQGKGDQILKEFPAGDRGPAVESELAVIRGYALFSLRRQSEAEAEFTEAVRLRPQEPLPLVGLAQVRLNKRELAEGEALIDQALTLAPDLSDALALKGEFRRQAGDVENALNYFNKTIDANPNSIAGRLGRARILLDRDQFAEANDDVKAVLAFAPRNPIALFTSASILARQGNRREALDVLQAIANAKDVYPPVYLLLGVLHFQENQFEQADTNLSRYIFLTGGDLRSRKLLAAIQLRRGAPKRAIEILLPVAEAAADDAQFYGLLASAYMRDRRPAEAAKWLDVAARVNTLDAATRMQLAVGRLEAGQPEAAEKELERAIEIRPESSEARILLALTQIQRGNIDEAARTANELATQAPDNVVALNLSGSIEALRGDFPAARSRFEKALQQQPDFVPARLNLGRLGVATGDFTKADEDFNAVLRSDPKNLEAFLALADLSRRRDQPTEAARWLEKAAAENPKSTAPRAQLVDYHLNRGEPAKALAWARQMHEIDPSLPATIHALARAQLAAGDTGNALTNYRRLAASVPDSAMARHQLARALMATNDPEAAYKALQQTLQIDAAYAPAFADLLDAEIRAGRAENAAKLAEDWRAKRPGRAIGDRFVAEVAMRRGRYPDAVRAYEAAFKKEPSSVNAIALHQAKVRSGDADNAIADLTKWVAANPTDVAARTALGNSLIAMGRTDEAIAAYEQLVNDSPNNPVVLNNLAWLYDRKKDPRAVTIAERAYAAAPNQPAIADTYGYMLVRRGEVERGLKLLQEAHAKAPDSGEIAYHLAVALNAAKRPEEARAVLDRTLQQDATFEGVAEARKLLGELQKRQ